MQGLTALPQPLPVDGKPERAALAEPIESRRVVTWNFAALLPTGVDAARNQSGIATIEQIVRRARSGARYESVGARCRDTEQLSTSAGWTGPRTTPGSPQEHEVKFSVGRAGQPKTTTETNGGLCALDDAWRVRLLSHLILTTFTNMQYYLVATPTKPDSMNESKNNARNDESHPSNERDPSCERLTVPRRFRVSASILYLLLMGRHALAADLLSDKSPDEARAFSQELRRRVGWDTSFVLGVVKHSSASQSASLSGYVFRDSELDLEIPVEKALERLGELCEWYREAASTRCSVSVVIDETT